MGLDENLTQDDVVKRMAEIALWLSEQDMTEIEVNTDKFHMRFEAWTKED